MILGKREAGKAKIKRRETERKTGGKGSQGKGTTRSQKKAWPGETRKASWKGKKRERESWKKGEGRKRTTGKERKERWRKKKTGRGKEVWLFPYWLNDIIIIHFGEYSRVWNSVQLVTSATKKSTTGKTILRPIAIRWLTFSILNWYSRNWFRFELKKNLSLVSSNLPVKLP